MAAGLNWSWSAVGTSSCVIILWYVPRRCSEEIKIDLRRLSEVSSKNCLNEKAAVTGLVGLAGSIAVIGWIPHFLLWLVVRTQSPHSAAWFGGEYANPILLGEETDTSPLGSGESGSSLNFSYCLLYLYSVNSYHTAGPSEVFICLMVYQPL